jgi:hypothetical protein
MTDTSVQYENLAGVIVYKNDGNLAPEATAVAPRAMIVGTSGKGQGHLTYLVPSTTQAKSEFGNDGTLLRGMWEVKAAGADEIAMYRIGSKPAILEGVGNSAGGAGGYKIETVEQDADAGGNYAMYYDDSTDRLVVKRNTDDVIVFDNDETSPIERYEVIVSGYRHSGGGPDIGSASAFINLEDVDPSTYAGTSFTAGDDGLGMSRMEMYEELYVAYENIKQTDFDVIVPMDVYLDDYNVVNQGHYLGAITPESPSANTYPTKGRYRPGQDVDALGRLFVEEYEGEYYFWWWFNDGSGVFASADIWPTDAPGSATATTKIDGTTLTGDDFHEVNFAYQLGRFLYEYSTNVVDATGVIGVLPPASNSLVDKARWVGREPTWTLDTASGLYHIASANDNGSGLVGNKFMAGKYEHRSGAFGGGFIATEGKFMDSGAEIEDDNEIPVDLGKYFSVVVDYPLLRNSFSSTAYPASFAASYGGFYINMSPASAPTNKRVANSTLIFRLGLQALDDMAGAGYTCLRQKTTGLVVADAPTAALPTSDWNRLSTVRIVKAVIDGVRAAVDPFLGEGMSDATRASMQTSVEKVLLAAKTARYLQDYRPFEIIQTPQMEVQGKADINLTLIPAFELRQVTVTVSVSKSG